MKTHGLRNTGTYNTWYSMLERCRNPRNASWRYYGSRGIKVCERWGTLAAFIEDMGMRPDGKTLDRINPDGNYEKSNCRWSDLLTQNRTKRSTKCSEQMAADIRAGKYEHLTHREIARLFGGDQSTISRIKSGEVWR